MKAIYGTKTCARCGKPFAPRSGVQRYCSLPCGAQIRGHRAIRAKPVRTANCRTCNKPFTEEGCRKVYCSRECYNDRLGAHRCPVCLAPLKHRDREEYGCIVRTYYCPDGHP